MFKAFTDNIASLVGGGNKEESDSQSQSVSDSTAKDSRTDNEKETSSSSATGQQDLSQKGAAEVEQDGKEGGESGSGKKENKVPPPRPAPPLTPASSISKPDTPPGSPAKGASADQNITTGSAEGDQAGQESENTEEKKEKIDERLDEVAEKAKQWGSYFFNITKTAGASVSAKAKELKKAMQENTIIGDFVKEQDKFVSEKRDKARSSEAAVPPWVGYNEEAQMKEQMLNLSIDKRNFMRNPPPGVQFHFDYDTCFPVAMATLAEDENLQKMRFDLVPKLVNEHDFWRNYFYRVSLIKQSTQLTSLAKQSSPPEASKEQQTADPSENVVPDSKKISEIDTTQSDQTDLPDDTDVMASGQEEFVSDAYNLEISDEDLMKEMEALRAGPSADDDFEVVGVDDDELEKEIMEEMSKSTDDLK